MYRQEWLPGRRRLRWPVAAAVTVVTVMARCCRERLGQCRGGAAVDPGIAADWQRISEMRRQAFRVMFARIPAGALRPGLTPAAAADTAWAIASPETHDQLVRQAGYSYDQLEAWLRATVTAALLPDR